MGVTERTQVSSPRRAVTEPALPDDVADLARRIHYSRCPVVPLADVMFRLRRAGHQVTAEQVRQAILHPPKKIQVIEWT